MQIKGDHTYTGSKLRILSQHAFNKSSARNMNRNMIRGSIIKSSILNSKTGNIRKAKQQTYKAPEYLVGSGATIDLFILLISACISCSID